MSSYLKFQVSFHTNLNQTVRIVGNIKDLGEWDVSKGLQLQTNAQIYPDWTHETFIEIPYGTLIEFKCVKFEGDRLVKWENFNIDMNRKYKTQFFKALLFMKEDNIQVIERPFQKYTGNHDYDIIDTTNAKKIQEKFIIFDPLRKADGLSSSSDNSSLDFFRRQSKVSEEFYQQDGQAENENNTGVRKLRQKAEFSDEDEEYEDYFNSMNAENDNSGWEENPGDGKNNNNNIAALEKEKEEQLEVTKRKQIRSKLGIKFNTSSLNQIEGKVPRHLENIFLLFNRAKKDTTLSQQSKGLKVRKISDFKDISYYGLQQQQQQQQQQQSQQIYSQQQQQLYPQNSSSNQSAKQLPRTVKSLPEIFKVDLNEKSQKTLIMVSFRLPYFIRNKKRKGPRSSSSTLSIEQSYDFVENIDPLIDSLYESLRDVKLNLIWVGLANICPESLSDREELRSYMLSKYNCWPLFYEEKDSSAFARQFCSRFLFPQNENLQFYEEETCWSVYKQVNMEVANTLKRITRDHSPIFAIAIYDFHFFLVPSYFQREKKRCQGSVQQFDQKEKITISFFMNRKFPELQIFEMLPQAEIFMHSLFFCDIMSFSTYENCEPFLSFAQKMGCAVVHKAGGKVMLQCNGREIFIRIEHPGINISKLQRTKEIISEECHQRASVLNKQNKHLVIGIDSVSKNSGLELKFMAFEKFLKREKYLKSKQEYKLKQIVYFSTDGEFFTLKEQQEYLDELKALARQINQAQCFYDSVIEVIEGDALSFEEYFTYLSLSECYISTVLQETRHFHYMEYLLLRKDGQLILSKCLNQLSSFNAVNIVNPQDQSRIVQTLSKVFANIEKITQQAKSLKINDEISSSSTLKIPSPALSITKQGGFFSSLTGDSSSPHEISDSSENTSKMETMQIQHDKSRINITEKNNTSDQAQREFDYNYLIKFCSSQNWIGNFISDIVKRQSMNRDTCIFCSTEEKSVILDQPQNLIFKEQICKIYERNSSQYIEINLQNLIYKCRHAKNGVFVLGFSSVFFESPSNLLAEPKINSRLFDQITMLAKRSNITIYIISGKSAELLHKYFGEIPNITLISNNGLKIQHTGQDIDGISLTKQQDPTFMKMCVSTRIENFVQKTAGSYITESEVSTSWHFENVEKEFADAQKEELVKQLLQIVESMPGYEIFEGYDFVQVRPSCLNKGVMTKISLQNSYLQKGKIDLLVVVGGSKTTDEEMLKSAREVVYDEKIAYLENNTPIILGSISSQLGALYCNHQFENNNELAVLLELMNGNKQLLMADQFTQSSEQEHDGIDQLNNNSNFIPPDPPHLLRKLTLCEKPVQYFGTTSSTQSQQQNTNPTIVANSRFQQNYPLQLTPEYSYQSPTYDTLPNKPKIKAFDMKIPFINQAHSLNQMERQMI